MSRTRRDVALNFPETTKKRFAEEYLLDLDPWAAAARCGLPSEYGPPLLARPEVQIKVRIARNRAMSQTEIYTDAVLKRVWQLADADARELTEVLLVNCRYCHGIEHRYQFTLNELRTARERYEIDQRALAPNSRVSFDDLPEYWGGDGFNPWGDPNPSCTEVPCGGLGIPQVKVADTRNLSPGAAALFDGVEISRDGSMRFKMRDRNWAFQMATGILGISTRGSGGSSVLLDPHKMSDEQLAMAIEAWRRADLLPEDNNEAVAG